jgi:hypothetical protein
MAHAGAQLKVENPVTVAHYVEFGFIAVRASVLLLQGNAYLPGSFD